jgi:hypothetical protein
LSHRFVQAQASERGDVEMEKIPMMLLRLVVGVAIIFGPVLMWLILLNLGDRRASRLRLIVSEPLASADLRGRLAIQVRCAVLPRSSTVIVVVLACTFHEVWDIFTRVASRLPPRVRFLIHGAVGRQFTERLSLEAKTGRLPSRRPRASLVAG